MPVAGKDAQNQSSHWLTVRKEKPDWMIMWGWGVMNPTAIKEAAKTRFPLDRFVGNWWSAAHVDLGPIRAKGIYKGAALPQQELISQLYKTLMKYVRKSRNDKN